MNAGYLDQKPMSRLRELTRVGMTVFLTGCLLTNCSSPEEKTASVYGVISEVLMNDSLVNHIDDPNQIVSYSVILNKAFASVDSIQFYGIVGYRVESDITFACDVEVMRDPRSSHRDTSLFSINVNLRSKPDVLNYLRKKPTNAADCIMYLLAIEQSSGSTELIEINRSDTTRVVVIKEDGRLELQ